MTAPQAVRARTGAAGPMVVGAVGGLAWAAGLRGLMVEVAGPGSEVSWGGTFLGVGVRDPAPAGQRRAVTIHIAER